MHCIPTYLSKDSSYPYKNTSLGEVLQQKGINALWEERGTAIDTLVIHAISAIERTKTSPHDREEILSLFLEYEVSAHYLILRNGVCHALVPEEKKAWHCGKSIMPPPDNRHGVNAFSIGIELVGGEPGKPFTPAQYNSLVPLIKDICSRHSIQKILGHEDIAGSRAIKMGIRPDEKKDPGPNFNWKLLHGITSLLSQREDSIPL
ncbi:N-acetylmuramoyl-L-alanine amidase [Chitinivibrio alkaliphilus]|uniref:N-acetylmuramoyl-L-alanine amidase n=1 Tax=Chitinivibrio alkaliphilus ACht1 TaxID=1313304 RepID=U7DE09_9BACT|nr:N-acetylmuramoyl-L-alanine amidase [Chitinivibrio alkaliphilus]ERP39151.1 N-acetyl-anhydromuranmyl-L-alanine amidase [Chitinivibrio alkaliphilus ACht1]